MNASALFQHVLETALAEVRAAGVSVFTFALYHDHESSAVSVCVDTEDNSWRAVEASNRYSAMHFQQAIAQGDLPQAALWQASTGRNLSLGDFLLVNLARTNLGEVPADDQFYLKMVQAVMANQLAIAALSTHPARLLLACSGRDSEVALVWSPQTNSDPVRAGCPA